MEGYQEMLDIEVENYEDEYDQVEPLNVKPENRKLVTQPYDYSLETISQRVNSGKLILDIDYQRQYIWDETKASRLIESFLMNVPIPVCYFAETDSLDHEVIDGLQRVTAINNFLNGKFALRGISVLTEYIGMTFNDLPARTQNQLENRTIRCIVITAESHPDIKFDVFERLNTGSVKLSAQELRNCVYRGDLNSSFKELAKDPRFQRIMGNGKNLRMNLEEMALRFFSFIDVLPDYRPPLRQMLNEYMRSNRSRTLAGAEVSAFLQTCDVVWDVFGNKAFSTLDSDGNLTGTVNKALFDAIMLPLSTVDPEQARARKAEIQNIKSRLFENEEFVRSIGRATADRSRVRARIGMFQNELKKSGINSNVPLPQVVDFE